MQLSNCNIFINFNLFEKILINFFYKITKTIALKRSIKRVRFVVATSYFVSNVIFRSKISTIVKKLKFALFKSI